MGDLTIKLIGEATRLEPSGQVVRQISVEFKVGIHGPFTRFFPLEGFDPLAARAELERFARGLDQLAT